MKSKITFFKRFRPQPYLMMVTVLLFAFSFNQVNAQDEGSTCENPIEVSDLPFNDSGNTADYGNNYNQDDVPEEAEGGIFDGTGTTNYLDGYEAVYAFTPSSDEIITITSEKELEGANDWPGLYVFKGCPFSSTIAYHTATDSAGGLRTIEDLPVTAGETYYIVISNWYDVESDYTINITKLEDCTEADAGIAMEDFTVCAETAFTLENDQTDLNESGLTYQWEQSTDGDNWTEIEGADTQSYTVSDGISAETFYRLTVTCEFGGSDTSDLIEVTLKPYTDCFCIPDAGDNSDEIRNFSLSNIDNNSEASESVDGYSDYTESVEAADLFIGEAYTASLTSGSGYGSHGAAIWIDYNDNGIFEEHEMVTYITSMSESSTVDFPEFVVEDYPGTHRLRVQYTHNVEGDELDPCEVSTNYSETEDYMVEIPTLEDCEGTPTAGTVETEMAVCANVAIELSAEGASDPAGGLDRIWQSSPAGENEWTDIEGSNNPNYTLEEGIDEPTDFRFSVTCTVSDESDVSEVIETTINPAEECYCEPEGTDSNRYIDNFVTSDGQENISNTESGFSENGYGEFLDMKVSQLAEGEVSFEAEVEGGSAGFRIWVDWNQDGNFDEEEEVVYSSSGYLTSHQGTISMPENAELGETRMRIASHYLNSAGNIDPCDTDFSYGEFEDYTFEVIPLEDCTGTPDAGIAMDDFSVCEGVPFELTVEGASERANGLERIWQSSVAGEGDWVDIEDATMPTYFVEDGIIEEMEYRFKLFCEYSDETVYSDIIEVSLTPTEECYCDPEGTNSNRYIDNFVTSNGEENITNTDSGFSDNGYGEFLDMKASQVAGGELSFEADVEGGTAGFRIWVDWNQDGNFDEEEEVVYNSSDYSASHSGTIVIPEEATPGETRMRIASHYLSSVGDIDPCETDFSYGEFEDYTFEVIALEDCTGTPDAGIVMEDFSICEEIGFEISVEESSGIANGLERIWQSSGAGEDDWTDIEDATMPTYFVEGGITEEMEYRFKLHCEYSEETVYSDIIEVSLKPDNECHCIPTGSSNNSDEIVNFTLENINNDSSTGDGVDGYSDFTNLPPAELIPGIEYVAELTSGSGSGSHGAAIWIDYNQNGEFDEDEMVTYLDSDISNNETVEFPAFTVNAAPGVYTLRVQYHFGKDGDLLDPCETTSPFSETEDYLIEVLEVDCFPPHNILIDYITDNSADVSWDAEEENSSWVVYYGEEGFDPENGEGESIEVNDEPELTLTDLEGETAYEVYIIAICGEDESVLVGPKDFTTLPTPPENTRVCDAIALEANAGCLDGPYTNEHAFEESGEPLASCFNDYHGSNTVWFTFEAPANGIAFVSTDFNSTEFNTELAVFEAPEDCADLTTFGEEVGCATSGDVELTELTPGATYYIQVAGFNDEEGQFCIEVEMDDVPVCEAPTDIFIDNIDATEVEISWTDNGVANQWEVVYGETGFDMESAGENIIVDIPETTLTNLEEDTDYDVYVRAICENLNSDWTGPETFTTEEMSVDNEIFQDFSFYPNPVKDQLTLKAGSQIESVEVFNLLGQRLISVKPNNLETQINTETLQSGVYLMEVSINGNQKSFRIVKR